MTEHICATGNPTDVQAKLDICAAGDVVTIPAGDWHWSSQVAWEAPPNVILRGQGSSSVLGGGDVTNIIDDFNSNNSLLNIVTNAIGKFRLYGITGKGGTGIVKENGIFQFSGNCHQFRVDHCHIDKSTYTTPNTGKFMLIGGTLYGVIDNCIIDPGPLIGWFHIVNGYPNGHAVWAADTGFGTGNFIFLEDNRFNGVVNVDGRYFGVLTDCHTGGRYVARYNTVIAGGLGQTHPTGHAGDDRGARAHELYGNVCSNPGFNPATEEPNFAFEYNNSGPALVWGNSVGGVFKNIIYFNVIRKDNATYSQVATPNGWGYAGTEFNGTGSNWDQNTSALTGYACLDMPGRGKGDLLVGTFPDMVNQRTGTIAWPEQALEPVYEWLNDGDIIEGWGGSWLANIAASRIQENRDYYRYNAAFDGGAGVGVGLLANRPTVCVAGVAYWATDAQTLYRAIATNTWEAYYTPYQYPHPLRSDGIQIPFFALRG